MPLLNNNQVTAANLVRSFAQYRAQALSEPLFITNHGRRTHVLMGVGSFDALAFSAGRDAGGLAEQFEVEIEFAEWSDEAVLFTDQDGRIVFANRNFHAISRSPRNSLNGKALIEALPEIAGSLIELHWRHALSKNEPASAEIPSPFTNNAWVSLRTFPMAGHVAIVLRDITDQLQVHRLADVKEALLEAMTLHGGIGYIRLSSRGAIERVNQTFCSLLGLPEDRLAGLPFIDLADRADRVKFRAELNGVLRGEPGQRLSVGYLTNEGRVLPLTTVIKPLEGAYGSEGVLVLVTLPMDESL